MVTILIVIGIVYLLALVGLSLITRQKNKDSKTYFLAGSKVGSLLGIFTLAATLFSTFTIIGMPDFFRTHGIGSWFFLAFSDAAMVFGILSVGYYLRKRARTGNFKGLSGLMAECYTNKWAGYITFIGAFIFLIPYVAIQIRGIAIFMHAIFPEALPVWGWAASIVIIMLIYSEVGGLKAIIYNDMLQGLILLVVICLIAYNCVSYFGDLGNLFAQVGRIDEKLLSVPGPKGLFTTQFMIASSIAIIMIPFTQPQVVTRIIIMKNYRSLFRMSVGLGVFAMIIIFATLCIGMYGAVKYPELSTANFVSAVLITDQSDVLGALAILGIVAAAISTSDSQLFALGGDLRSLLTGNDKKMMNITRVGIACFAVIVFVFSMLSSDELVMLARTSFAGTGLMAPMIFVGILSKRKIGILLPIFTLASMLLFIASLLKIIPDMVLGVLRLDLFLMLSLGLLGCIVYFTSAQHSTDAKSP
jgi:SSS family solute:Na+ symporter